MLQGFWLFEWCQNIPAGHCVARGAQWLSGRVLDSRPKGRGFEPHRHHCVVVLEQDTFILAKYWFNPGRPSSITERLLSGRKESNQTNKQKLCCRGAGCLSGVGTYLPGTVLQGYRLFKRCRNLPAGHCCRGVGCLSNVRT